MSNQNVPEQMAKTQFGPGSVGLEKRKKLDFYTNNWYFCYK